MYKTKEEYKNNLSTEKYGKELASNVAEAMLKDPKKEAFFYLHRDYCGMGLIYTKNEFKFVSVLDAREYETKLAFTKKDSFVNFLADQSDFTMSGMDKSSKFFVKDTWEQGNQRITKKRLLDGVSKVLK